MDFCLIPQPRELRAAGEGACPDPKRCAAVLRLPSDDGRLTRLAGKIFAGAHAVPAEGEFTLTAGEGCRAPDPPEKEQGYSLAAGTGGFTVRARSAQGLFYGMQTLRQLAAGESFPPAEIVDWPDIGLRCDHFDLRYVHPSPERLARYAEESASFKFNAILVEYEDKLPFRGHPQLCGSEALTPEQLEALLRTAWENYMEVIPLQQSFGHLEYVLKHPEYRGLREDPASAGELCPLRPGAFELAASLLDETAALHPQSRFLHLGCDEAWTLGSSPECRASGKSREEISAGYINRLAGHVCSLGKTPIVWHDMFAAAPQEVLRGMDRRTAAAVWIYDDLRVRREAPALLARLREAGFPVFVCSAAMCHDGALWQDYPRLSARLRDADAWAEVCAGFRPEGYIQTNWLINFSMGRPYGLFETSRYSSYYGAFRSWNLSAPTGNYLRSYLSLYHGVPRAELYGGGRDSEDFFRVLPGLLGQVRLRRTEAEAVALSVRLEGAASCVHTMFRSALYPESGTERESLERHARRDFAELAGILAQLRARTDLLMTPAMSRAFCESRAYPYRLFRRELEQTLGCALPPLPASEEPPEKDGRAP